MPEDTWFYNPSLGNTDSQSGSKQLKKTNVLWMKRKGEPVSIRKYQIVVEG